MMVALVVLLIALVVVLAVSGFLTGDH